MYIILYKNQVNFLWKLNKDDLFILKYAFLSTQKQKLPEFRSPFLGEVKKGMLLSLGFVFSCLKAMVYF